MTPDDRAAVAIGLRIGGGVLVVLGLWLWFGGSLGGHYGSGAILVIAGLAGALLLPLIFARRWR